MAKKVLTLEEKKNHQDFLEVCAYIEKELLGYENNQKLQRMAALKVKGMAKGQVVANNKCEKYGEYPFEVILLTLKANKNIIINALKKKNIESESGSVGYIAAIIRDKLNDMYTRYINAKKIQEKVDNVNTDIITYQGAEYKAVESNDNKIKDKYKDLW